MIYIFNTKKEKNTKIGLNLINTIKGVQIDSIIDYPAIDIRNNISIGDYIISVNGTKSLSAFLTSKLIIESGPNLSLCLKKDIYPIFEKNNIDTFFI